MAIVLDDSIRVGQQKPTDDRYFNNLVPYISVAEANNLLPLAVRYLNLTVNINGVEYWYQGGINDLNLVIKSNGGYKVVFINGSATGIGDGSSYENGFTTLQSAFLNATEYTIFNIYGSVNPYTVTDTIICLLNNIKIVGVYEQSSKQVPTIKILTSKNIFKFSGSNVEFSGIDVIGDVAITNLTLVDEIILFSGTTKQQNLIIKDINFRNISSSYINGLLRVGQYTNVIIENIKYSDCNVITSIIRFGYNINLKVNGLSIYQCQTSGLSSGLVMSYGTIGIISNVFIYKCNSNSLGTGCIYWQYMTNVTKSLAINDMVLDKWVVLNSDINQGFYTYGNNINAQNKLTISNSLIKDCFGASYVFTNRNASDTSELNVINCTTINPLIGYTYYTFVTTTTSSITKFIGCILQDPLLLDSNKTNNYVTFDTCYIPPVSTDDAIITNCIIGSNPNLIGGDDYKLKSSSLCVDVLDYELIKPYLRYDEQNYDIYGNIILKPKLNIGAIQEVVYINDTTSDIQNTSIVSGATVTDALNNLQSQIQSSGDTIPVENITVWSELSGYTSGNTFVSYINTGSSDPQFQNAAIYRCIIDTIAGESPETNPEKWEYNGQYIVSANASTSITRVELITHLKQLTGYKSNHTVGVLETNIIYKYDSTTNSGIKPNDNPPLGSWVFMSYIENVYTSNFTVQLLGGKTFGKYVNGQIVPASGMTATQLLKDIAIEYLIPSFSSFSSAQPTTIEVGTTISTPMSFTFGFNNISNVSPNTLKIIDVTNSNNILIQNQPLTSPISTPIGLMIKTTNGATNSWKGQAANTNLQLFDSSNFTTTWRLKTFYGAVITNTPIDSSGVRGLANSVWDNNNSFSITLNQLKYSIAIRSGKGIVSIITQNNENITSNFINGGTINVLLADGITSQSYTIYNFTSATIMNVNANVILS